MFFLILEIQLLSPLRSDQSPNVKLVDAGDPLHWGDQPLLQVHQVDVGGDGVEEDEGGVPQQGPGGGADDEDDEEAEDGVEVVPVLPVWEPDDGGADHDDEAAQGVCQDMQEHPGDVHLPAWRLR